MMLWAAGSEAATSDVAPTETVPHTGCRDRRAARMCASKLSNGLCNSASGWGCALTCGDCNLTRETSTIPSPRTMWSALHRNEKLTWHLLHRQLVTATAAYKAGTLVLIGDSIMEGWRGRRFNRSVQSLQGVAGVFNATMEGRWPHPLNLGISGDMTQHVLWRLLPGSELSVLMQQDSQMLMALSVGTNNLLRGNYTAEETHAGVDEVISALLRNTRGRLLVNALFPFALPDECTNANTRICETESTKAVAMVNRLIRRSISRQQAPMAAGSGRVRFVDCGRQLWQLRETHMSPDHVHPSLLGYEAWGRCMLPELMTLAQPNHNDKNHGTSL